MFTLLVFLFIFVNKLEFSASEFVVNALLSNGTWIYNQTQINSQAIQYRIQAGPKNISIWQPFDQGLGGGGVATVFLNGIYDWIYNGDGSDYSVDVFNVGWGGVVGTPICQGNEPCPEIIVLGTTQIAQRQNNQELADLTDLLQTYAFTTGTVLTDDFVRYCFYDFNYAGRWFALPLVSDIRILFWNKTTFDALSLPYPPPHGDWSEGTWTWSAFANLSKTITQKTGLPGFNFKGCWDEDWKIMNMIAQSYDTSILDNYHQSNLGKSTPAGQALERAFSEVIIPLFTGPNASTGEWVVAPWLQDVFQTWLSAGNSTDPLYPGNGNGAFCCDCPNPGDANYITGMMVDTAALATARPLFYSSDLPNYTETIVDSNNTLINVTLPRTYGMGLVPGKKTFLGGSALTLTAKGPNKDGAWSLATWLVDSTKPYVTQFGLAVSSIPPWESAWNTAPWDGPQYAIVREQMKSAVPAQYPLQTYSQLGDLEARKPIRFLWMDMAYKNMSYQEATDRANLLFRDVFLRPCNLDEDLVVETSPCDAQLTRVVSFHQRQPQMCKGNLTLPASTKVDCQYVVTSSSIGGALIGLATVGLALAFVCLCLVIALRERPAIRRSSWRFGIVITLSAMLCFASVLASVGPPAVFRAILQDTFLAIGFGGIFIAFAVKMYRIDQIFNTAWSHLAHRKLDDQYMFFLFGIAMFFELGSLGLYFGLRPPSMFNYNEEIVIVGLSSSVEVEQQICQVGNQVGAMILLIFNGFLLAVGIYFAIRVRKAPSDLQEHKFIGTTVLVVALVAVIVVPLVAFQNRTGAITIRGLGVLFATSVGLAVYFFPKFYLAFKNIDVTDIPLQNSTHRDLRYHRKFFHYLRPRVEAILRASAPIAGKSLELFAEILASEVGIPGVRNAKDFEEQEHAITSWLLPTPEVALGAVDGARPRSESSGGSLHESQKNKNSVGGTEVELVSIKEYEEPSPRYEHTVIADPSQRSDQPSSDPSQRTGRNSDQAASDPSQRPGRNSDQAASDRTENSDQLDRTDRTSTV